MYLKSQRIFVFIASTIVFGIFSIGIWLGEETLQTNLIFQGILSIIYFTSVYLNLFYTTIEIERNKELLEAIQRYEGVMKRIRER